MERMIAVHVVETIVEAMKPSLEKHGFKFGVSAQGVSIFVGPKCEGDAIRAEFRKLCWTRPCGKTETEFLLS